MNNSEHSYARTAITLEALADLETPLSVYLKLAAGPYSYLLESSQGGEKWGRYSIIGLPARTVLKVFGDQITISTDGEVVETHAPLAGVTGIVVFLTRYTPQVELVAADILRHQRAVGGGDDEGIGAGPYLVCG